MNDDLLKERGHKDPPVPPPCRSMREGFSLFGSGGLYETDESKQATREWYIYMSGYRHGFDTGIHHGNKPI